MKSKSIIRSAVFAVLAATILSTFAGTLNEGDPAPKLQVAKWIQGEPVKTFEPGKVYLVEFWASWWPPCQDVMAHLNRLDQKFKNKGLIVIGQNVKERPTTKIEPYVKRLGNLISYRIATDAGASNRWSGKMVENWLYAAEAGIPTAFIVDKNGKTAFIGHPDEIDDKMIEDVLAGTFDLKKRAAAREAAAAKNEIWDAHSEAGKAAFKSKQWTKAMNELDELEKINPRKHVTTQCLRIAVLIGQQSCDAASKTALQLADEHRDDPFLQHRIARTIAKANPTNTVVLNTANQLVDRATAMLKGPEPEFLHTQARLAFLEGKKDKAIQLETEAAAAADPDFKDQFEMALVSFKQGKLPQLSF
jgi:thiol-disulfide isomerase/thioredoxin